MINISALRLGRDETIREEKAQRGSADILASYCENNVEHIMAIDCTITVPDGTKIDMIKNTADYRSRKIRYPIKPVIVTSANTSVVKEDGKKNGVKIIDHTDIEKILMHYDKGHNWPAVQVILN